MRLNRLVRSSTFRLTLVYLGLFGLSAAALLGFVYLTTVQVIVHQTDETIEAEIGGLAEHYRDAGLPGLRRIVEERSQWVPGERGIYLLTDSGMNPVAGNIEAWPKAAGGEPGWVDFLIETGPGADELQVARARTFVLDSGHHLLVGRDMTERSQFRALITEALLGAIGLTILFGGVGGILMSRWLLSRIDAINRGSRQILSGDMHQRMPVRGTGDEFDQLSENLNAMLDQIERLMVSMRHVTDDIAHDLRSPISRLRSRLEVTLLAERDPETYRQALQASIAEADEILSTFNALLDIGLAESGALRDRFEVVDLAALVRDVGELYEPLAEDKSVDLKIDAEDYSPVFGNAQLLSQMTANLLDNAVKYVDRGGHVDVEVRSYSKRTFLCVGDDGPGIPEDAREQVLGRFSRLEQSRHEPGSGLGLSLVAAVAGLHDATLDLSDNAPGLRVRLDFPAGGETRSRKA